MTCVFCFEPKPSTSACPDTSSCGHNYSDLCTTPKMSHKNMEDEKCAQMHKEVVKPNNAAVLLLSAPLYKYVQLMGRQPTAIANLSHLVQEHGRNQPIHPPHNELMAPKSTEDLLAHGRVNTL